MQFTKSRVVPVLIAVTALFGAVGCSLLMDFNLCQNHEDCHVLEGDYALICRSGNCVEANCHSDSECPGENEYRCSNQRCVHLEDHEHGGGEDASHGGEDASHDGESHGDTGHGGDPEDADHGDHGDGGQHDGDGG